MKPWAQMRPCFSKRIGRKNKRPAQTERLSIPKAGLEPALPHGKWILNPVRPEILKFLKLRSAAYKYSLSRLIAWVAVCAFVCCGVAVGGGDWVEIVRGGHECGHVLQSTNPGVPGERVW